MTSTTNAPAVAPCPFCGSSASAQNGPPELWYVECHSPECGVDGKIRSTKDAAIAAWNSRASPAAAGVSDTLTEEIARDALRYRWLRVRGAAIAGDAPNGYLERGLVYRIGNLDEAVDAAMGSKGDA